MKKIIFLLFFYFSFFIGSSSVFAQSDTIPAVSTYVGLDLMSRYIWRGQDYGQTPSMQPELSVSWKDFTLGYWGAYRIAGSGDHETDFYLEKTIGPVTLSLWDYWCYSDSTSNNYFDYNKNTTSHVLEAQILISGGEKLPFNLLGSYLFYGADPSKSVYFELQYMHSFGSVDTQTFAGFQAKGEYYGDQSSFVNLGCTASYLIKEGKTWSIPLGLSFIVNPVEKSTHLLIGITFSSL